LRIKIRKKIRIKIKYKKQKELSCVFLCGKNREKKAKTKERLIRNAQPHFPPHHEKKELEAFSMT
jgi:hypothetical protein